MHHPKYLLGGLGITLATWVEFPRACEVRSRYWASVDRRRLTDIALLFFVDRPTLPWILVGWFGYYLRNIALLLGITRPTFALVSRHHLADIALFPGITLPTLPCFQASPDRLLLVSRHHLADLCLVRRASPDRLLPCFQASLERKIPCF
jgi:hypothetical protein